MSYVLMFFQLLQIILATVHSVEAAMPGEPGAAKSQLVIDKVSPIAQMLNANAAQIQSMIDAAVAFFNLTGIFKGNGQVVSGGIGGGLFSSLLGALTSHASVAPVAAAQATPVQLPAPVAAPAPAASVTSTDPTPIAGG